jgi:hypothetical protein
MLILPQDVIDNKVSAVRNKVIRDIIQFFMLPFSIASITLMLIISYCLKKISWDLTEPIIELQDKIKDIIKYHQKEKDLLIKQ